MGYRWNDGGYSSDVKLFLHVDGVAYPVAQIGPDTLILRDDVCVRSGHAQIIIVVDGHEETHDVIINSHAPATTELVYA